MTIGRPRPLPGYPTTLALYPISVRRVRVQGHRLPSDPTSRWAPLPSLAVPVITARGGLAPLTSTTCLAHKRVGGGLASPVLPHHRTYSSYPAVPLNLLASRTSEPG